MTRNEAYRLLGISRSVGIKPAEQAYRQKCKECQMNMIPGNSVSVRKKAQEELAQLTTAWHAIQIVSPRKQTNTKPTKTTPKPKPVSAQKVDDLANSWDSFFSMLPFPRPIAVTFAVLAIAASMFFIHQYMKGN
ncbi:MAG: hypothetical protein K9M75_05185 [Phycisphaerae bacterium]|nr:hypothetical protein [Phycisphaerae bacterium]